MNYIIRFFRFIFQHKWKILTTVFFVFIFLFVLFPFKDLNDFISSKISALTQNKVFVQFDDLSINPLSTTLHLDKVFVETEQLDHLNIEKLSATPSIMALIAKKPGGTLNAQGVLGGNAVLKVTPHKDDKSNNSDVQGNFKADINLTTENLSLKELRKVLALQLPLEGAVNLNTNLTVDSAFVEQPEGDVQISIQKFVLSSATVQIPDLGALNVPELRLSVVDLKGKMQNGKFTIETGKLGSASDELNGTIRGEIGLMFQNMNGQIHPVVNSYNISIDLLAKPIFKDRASFFLSFIDQYKRDEAGSTRYKFKLVSNAPGMPPQFSPLN